MTDDLHHGQPRRADPRRVLTWGTGDGGAFRARRARQPRRPRRRFDQRLDGFSAGSSAGTTATAILESIRDAVDEPGPSVPARPSANSPPVPPCFAADAADKAAPYVKRAGDATADASGKLATKSRPGPLMSARRLATADADAPHAAGPTSDAHAGPRPPPTAPAADDGSPDSATPA